MARDDSMVFGVAVPGIGDAAQGAFDQSAEAAGQALAAAAQEPDPVLANLAQTTGDLAGAVAGGAPITDVQSLMNSVASQVQQHPEVLGDKAGQAAGSLPGVMDNIVRAVEAVGNITDAQSAAAALSACSTALSGVASFIGIIGGALLGPVGVVIGAVALGLAEIAKVTASVISPAVSSQPADGQPASGPTDGPTDGRPTDGPTDGPTNGNLTDGQTNGPKNGPGSDGTGTEGSSGSPGGGDPGGGTSSGTDGISHDPFFGLPVKQAEDQSKN